ncbi:MAG: hypothetical protein A3C15_03000 [Candidatus Magasanikbacteria bacterium RIFCSPHIGHO2_02_FULL_50_9b]|uniref:DUF3105 domain-containing protein n=1 Tax=Candidatus Magasanikbacteria bacterium RIFCSPHIGHO2_02_FULL_50_9b TaxID=1798682 RepID=A0A1F6M8P9_9BACT|nr:MAG: hypothetical protein A3C15_03000 [Candidatus Magasanikbacteria bacterium RIFCSPHIGHO2_02_FULL_50_9b]
MTHQHSSNRLTGWLVILLPAALVVILIVWAATRPRPGESVANQGNRHLTSPTEAHDPYNSKPPTSGPHTGKAPWGTTDTQIPDEIQVHNLEDGGVIVHYDPAQVATSTVDQLTGIVQPLYVKGRRVILEPYAGLETPIVLTAWTRMEKLPTLDEEKIKQFITAYEGTDHHVRGA